MFKKEINFISDLNLNKLQVLGDRFTISDLKKGKLHPALYQYISAAINKEIFNDRKRIEANSIFNYSGDRINNYFMLIADEIKFAQNFDYKFIKKNLQDAIVYNVNYLSQPNETLLNHIFGNEEIRTVEEIITGLKHAYYYKYLQKILFTYLDKKHVRQMSKEEFSSLLTRIDEISKETHLEDTLSTTVNSMSNFFDPNSKSSERIPYQAIKLFLEEKKLFEFISEIEVKYGLDTALLIPTTELLQILKSVTPESELDIEETSSFEEEIEIDSSEEIEVIEDSVESEIVENKMDVIVDENSDLLDINVEEIEIPNNELLAEEIVIVEEEHIQEVIIEFVSDETSEIDSGDSEEEINENKQDSNKEEKKKIDSVKILKELVDIDSVYQKISPVRKPFDNIEEENHPQNLIDNFAIETEYQIDPSNIKEELIANIDEESNNQDIQIRNEYSDDDLNGNVLDNNLSYDEISLDGNNGKSNFDIKLEQHDEITEVFTDLSFLENEVLEEINNKATSKNITIYNNFNEEDYLEKNKSQESESKSDFEETLKNHDTIKIIEHIFDYDMEDYHSIIYKISEATDEKAALEIVSNYYRVNHIETKSVEVEQFALIISKYFNKILT